VAFQLLTTNDLPGVMGTVSGDWWSAPMRGYLAGYGSKGFAPPAGKYTLALQDVNTNLVRTVPDGCSVAAVTVNSKGTVAMSALVADGTKFSWSSSLSRDSHWPLYVSLYKNQGVLIGWLQLTNTTGSAIQGESLRWVKNGTGSASYPDGFSTTLQAVGSTFTTAPKPGWAWPPVPAGDVLRFTDAVATLGAGDMFSDDLFSPDGLAIWEFVNVSVPSRNKMVAEKTPEKLKLAVSSSNGMISGSFVHPMTKKTVPIRGIVLQGNGALGYFLSGNCSGFFSLSPPDAPGQ